jgi:lipopolysaccharide/colanic/teichoic acid biosynthesis glycosyltransferase
MQRRVEYDLQYLRHWSLLLDLKILARTLVVIHGRTRGTMDCLRRSCGRS